MTTTTLHTAAAESLAAQLPTAAPLSAVAQPGGAPAVVLEAAADAVVASFVGGLSADLALVLTDLEAVVAAGGTDHGIVAVTDVLRPSLEAAAEVLGVGVLGEARRESAASLFADPETVVFALTAGGVPGGWFGLRVRENGTVSAPAATPAVPTGNLGRINNVEMTLTVEIGRTRMSVRDVLGMEPGAVVELDRSAGAPADVLLNGRLIAHGEVVVVDQDYAVRITKILDVAESV
ncbi:MULTISPECIES: flagellar motor switch protein FliN [Curtobacterium]|uniref:flagellar motor switch protein FliN n=1 Tax=Curtobacterium TaxID=2034 RepID=UPI001580CD73|nr:MULTISPECIES: flagellar motor switch protein FliN [Curtobacterium]MDK8171379.1 flagellar motor switch protein FliN [Curtobacterium citreum]QKS16924.1 flagellar motor switch protein FliN [Curtobacterium sp. Csp2]WIJ46905.1 flagellar motor switch protein FliN [Curtobacterium citreum]